MTQKNIRAVGMGLLVALWLVLVGFSWFGEHNAYSDAERRKLAQAPELKKETIMDRTYMGDFETFFYDNYIVKKERCYNGWIYKLSSDNNIFEIFISSDVSGIKIEDILDDLLC